MVGALGDFPCGLASLVRSLDTLLSRRSHGARCWGHAGDSPEKVTGCVHGYRGYCGGCRGLAVHFWSPCSQVSLSPPLLFWHHQVLTGALSVSCPTPEPQVQPTGEQRAPGPHCWAKPPAADYRPCRGEKMLQLPLPRSSLTTAPVPWVARPLEPRTIPKPHLGGGGDGLGPPACTPSWPCTLDYVTSLCISVHHIQGVSRSSRSVVGTWPGWFRRLCPRSEPLGSSPSSSSRLQLPARTPWEAAGAGTLPLTHVGDLG